MSGISAISNKDAYLGGSILHDDIRGRRGDDSLLGGQGGDKLFGGDGADRVLGAAGKDALSGGAGDDTLDGGAGIDAVQGGRGADMFIFTADGDRDKLLDFKDGSDLISVGVAFAALTITTLAPGRVQIDYSGDVLIVTDSLGQLTVADLTTADFF